MDWEKYSENFVAAARQNVFDEDYIKRCLEYAKRLAERNLPIIYSYKHLSLLVGIKENYICSVAYSQEPYYRNFTIAKKNGNLREISEPLPNLKIVQRWILDNILYKIEPSPYAKGFVPGRSIKENARFHKKQEMVLCLDIKDFFSSISSAKVRQFFLSCGYSSNLTYYLTRLCTLNGGLPQGAPTSPALSNLIFAPIDNNISKYCLENKIRYSRYADDLTFSGSFVAGALINSVKRYLDELKLTINAEKTRLMRRHECQEVTSVVVNEKLQAIRKLRRDLRQAVYYIERFGLNAHLDKIQERRANYTKHLIGQATFILFLNPGDKDARSALETLRKKDL